MSVLGSASDAFIASIASLYLLALQAKAIHIGLLATTEHLQKAGRLVGLRVVTSLGKARLMGYTRVVAALPVVVLIGLPYLGAPFSYAVILAIVVFSLREFLRQTGNTVWWALIQDNTAGDAFGAYMARLRIRQRGTSLLVPIVVGWYLGTDPSPERFSLPFTLGIAASFLAGFWALRISEGPLASPEGGVFKRVLRAYRLRPVQWLSLFMFLTRLLQAAAFSFWVIAFTSRGISAMVFVWMTSAAAFGEVCSYRLWGRLVDRYGGRPTLSLTLWSKALLGLAWIWLPDGIGPLTVWGFAVYIVYGMMEGGQSMGRTQAMMDTVSSEQQVESFNAIMYASAVGGMIGGIGGGLLFDRLATQTYRGVSAELLYLGVMQAGSILAYLIALKFEGAASQTHLRHLILGRFTSRRA